MSFLGVKSILVCSSICLITGLFTYNKDNILKGAIALNSSYITASNEIAFNGDAGERSSIGGQPIICTEAGGGVRGIEILQGVEMTEDVKRRMISEDGRCLSDTEMEEGEEDEEDEE